MGFFDQRPEPPPPPPEPRRPAWARPETVLPGAVADTVILARTGDLVLTLGDLQAYPNGFQLAVTAYTREPLRHRSAFGSGGFLRRFGPGPVPEDFLRFGLRFADGSVVTNLDPGPSDESDAGPRLVPQGGHGGLHRHEQSYWVWPLPPPGRLDVVCEWPARGIAETTAELDAALVLDAASRATTLFDD
ncbi:hypothetical protein [Dactylosporangium sp. NPDC049140]|jgi:hypothetical protein|uniref:hypothetical protein n=1 Tax=Dactylosporangium sp. NPDC049140 TaxID=3155647 RepID=UPI00340CEE10